MLRLVTKLVLVSTTALLASGCSSKSGGGASKAAVCSVGVRDATHDKAMLAWKSRLPSVLRYEFTRDKHGAVLATPRCVKTADQDSRYSYYVEKTGMLGLNVGEKLFLSYDYVFLPKAGREAIVDLVREGRSWRGRFEENSVLSWLRSYDITIPECTDAELTQGEVYQHRDKSGRLTRLRSLTESNELVCD